MFSHDPGQHGLHRLLAVLRGAGNQPDVVHGVVERRADVVAHPAVDADVAADLVVAERDVLDGADLVKRDRARPGDRAAGLTGDTRHRQLGVGAFLPHHLADLGDHLRGRRRVVLVGVGDAEAAAEVHRGHLGQRRRAVLVAHLGQQAHHPVRGDLEAVGVEDLRADVAVQADQLERARVEHAADSLRGVPRGQRETELLVLVGGRDELVRVRLDADGDADQHRLDDVVARRDVGEAGDLVVGVEDDRADARGDRGLQLVDRLVVAVEGDPLRREVGAQGHGEFADAAHVQAQPLLGHPARDLDGEERLGRVVHQRRVVEGLGVVGAARLEVGFVHNEQRRAVLVGQLAHVHRGDPDDPVVRAESVARPDFCRKLVEFVAACGREPGEVGVWIYVGVPRARGVRHGLLRSIQAARSRTRSQGFSLF